MSQTNAPPGHGTSGQMNINDIEETMMNVVYNVASIVTLPVEILLRPFYGTRYFAAPTQFLSAMMLVVITAFFGVAMSIGQMIPFGKFHGPSGLFGLGSFMELFFLASFIHGIRVWQLMLHVEREVCSTFEGPPLFIFRLLPKGSQFWFTRIVWEPVLLFAISIVLSRLFIIQSPLALYLDLAAIFLAMKNYIAWFRCWSYIRNLLDMRAMGPVLGKIVDDTATDEDLAQVHLARLPKDLPPDIRNSTITHIARSIGFDNH